MAKPHSGGVAAHGQLAGHRGWVREGDVPPPAEGGSSRYFDYLDIEFYIDFE